MNNKFTKIKYRLLFFNIKKAIYRSKMTFCIFRNTFYYLPKSLPNNPPSPPLFLDAAAIASSIPTFPSPS